VADVGEARFRGDLVGPELDGPALHLHAAPAGAARQVVVMGVTAAAAVKRLAAGVADGVDLPALAEHLQVPVDGRQADVLAAGTQLSVDLLGAAEPRQARQHRGQRLGLPGAAHARAARSRRHSR